MSSQMSQIKSKILSAAMTISTEIAGPQIQQRNSIQKIQSCKIQLREVSNSPEEFQDQSTKITCNSQKSVLSFIPKGRLSPTVGKQEEPQLGEENIISNNSINNCTTLPENQSKQKYTTSATIFKISPPRYTNSANFAEIAKVVIPANQIRLLKKDGSSPSPDYRGDNIPPQQQQQKLQIQKTISTYSNSNLQNNNCNISNSYQNISGKNTVNRKSEKSPFNDDETNITSDNEEMIASNLTGITRDQAQNNFNRPKLNSQPDQQQIIQSLTTSSLNNTPSCNNNSNIISTANTSIINSNIIKTNSNLIKGGVKVISLNKIRNSPSPSPPSHFNFKNNQQQTTITDQSFIFQQQQQQQQEQQQSKKPQLASDFIKGMISSNKQTSSLPEPKKFGISNFKQKNQQQSIAQGQNNSTQNQVITSSSSQLQQQISIKEKKMQHQQSQQQLQTQINCEINLEQKENYEANCYLITQNSNNSQAAGGQTSRRNEGNKKSSKLSHHQNYSPPPPLLEINSSQNQILQQVNLKQCNESIGSKKSHQQQVQQQQQQLKTESNILETEEGQSQQVEEGGVFKFPFQRRGRNLSNNKQDGKGISPNPQIEFNKSPSPHHSPLNNEEGKRNGPVVAKTNFLIAHKGLVAGVQIKEERDSQKFQQNKEVDEWVEGFGKEEELSQSNASQQQQKLSQNNCLSQQQKYQSLKCNGQQSQREGRCTKQVDVEKAQQHCGRNEETESDIQDWMYKTFDPIKTQNTNNSNKKKASHKIQGTMDKRLINKKRNNNKIYDFGLEENNAIQQNMKQQEQENEFLQTLSYDLDIYEDDDGIGEEEDDNNAQAIYENVLNEEQIDLLQESEENPFNIAPDLLKPLGRKNSIVEQQQQVNELKQLKQDNQTQNQDFNATDEMHYYLNEIDQYIENQLR